MKTLGLMNKMWGIVVLYTSKESFYSDTTKIKWYILFLSYNTIHSQLTSSVTFW